MSEILNTLIGRGINQFETTLIIILGIVLVISRILAAIDFKNTTPREDWNQNQSFIHTANTTFELFVFTTAGLIVLSLFIAFAKNFWS